MSRDKDPLASPTLAQLYVTQGHDERANGVLDTILERTPLNGKALALRKRLAARSAASLAMAHTGDELTLVYKFSGAQPSKISVRVQIYRLVNGNALEEPEISMRCIDRDGELSLTPPAGPGSVCACLLRRERDGAKTILAVAEPVTW